MWYFRKNTSQELIWISFGPNIRAAHSPDEKVQISSVQKFWKFYLETLKRIPKIMLFKKSIINANYIGSKNRKALSIYRYLK